MRKNIPTSKKAAMVGMRLTRAAPSHNTSFTYKGQPVDSQKLQRYIKDSTRMQRKSKARPEVAEATAPISLEACKM